MGLQEAMISWGEVLWDVFPEGKQLGGAPANVAYHLAALGCPVAMVTRVGDDDAGREALAAMAARGVNTALVQVDAERSTGRVEVTVHDGEPRYHLVPGCAWERIEVTDQVADVLERARVFAFGTLSQRLSSAELERALTLLPAGCRTFCDLNLRPGWPIDTGLVRVSLSAARVVKLNEGEARMIEQQLGVADAIEWLLGTQGVELVALTRGAHGSVLITANERDEHPGIAARPGGDNVGAGDSFVAALICLLEAGRSLADINAGANRYAAYVASCRGATPEVPADLVAAVRGAGAQIG